MLLEGKIAWVTGASRGIGKAIAIELAAQGAELVLAARSEEHLAETAEQIRAKTGREPFLLGYDVADLSGIKQAFVHFQGKYKQLDILVNNAGVMEDALLPMVTQAQFQNTMNVNVQAAIFHMQYAARLMMRKKSGSIINISSIMGQVGNAGQVVYAASKAAVVGATRSASKELAPLNIRVNAVAPGFIETDLTNQLSSQKYAEKVNGIKMGRVGTAEEVAKVVLFLSSDWSSYVTGQVIGVDGGMIV
ncbi:SDR family NAD(P)-dependent oxidoreductase [Brevibacillus fulvus]|uniref:3-oxoacyl-[acyl-carrier protein] reductase n=1 Tax=Brevibacillus fulvus TaxID=1125967 RepID=A0A939BTG5_9BACL|nr:SDR family NAD(P)-dependent oxidoreductase [Brevibacillus fulvus]MBM7591483.1 3-oxoacyl-[acyl-carrier protein] reductase [Brevibacillus fulvus]